MRKLLLIFAPAILAAAPALAAKTSVKPSAAPRLKLEYLEPGNAVTGVRNPADIEKETGGRLGIAVVDAKGALLLGFNREDRFALCSTFKAPLAAAVLMGAERGRYGMDGTLPVQKSDLLEYAPAVRANLKRGRMSIAELAEAAVQVSDNSAANLLLPLVGGPAGLTTFTRAHGDTMTRLDRSEPELNENVQGDERDTTTPAAIATLMSRLLFTDMPPEAASRFRRWLEGSTTGAKRIRAGLPQGWTAGDKTGSCGNAYNDVAVVRSPAGNDYVIAVYLDRPSVSAEKAEAAIADVAKAAAQLLTAIEKRKGG